ncbi:hypothetical protein E4U41_002175 [Claviceps citrina]|nr:hypothetical protein E4U41_002175 [Claviceps citrina]
MFVANVGNGCGAVEGKDVIFPDPGPDVDLESKNTAPPTGKCGASAKYPSHGVDISSHSSSSAPHTHSSFPPSSGGSSTLSSDSSRPNIPIDASQPVASGKPTRTPNTRKTTWHNVSHSASSESMVPISASPASTPSSGSCKPGSFECANSPSGDGWQVCDVSGSWVFAGNCGSGQVCKFNAANDSPYCVPPV